jgi:hypothetical protein
MKKFIPLLFFFTFLYSIETFGSEERNRKHQLPYERFIGIGNTCMTRFQINSHLSQRFNKAAHEFGGGQLFDWLVIHDYNKFAEALENGLVDILECNDLILEQAAWNTKRTVVRNVKYNMTWSHLFTREKDESIVKDIFDIEYDIKKAKIDYLTKKFKNLKNYRTLYIISYSFFISPKITKVIEPTKQTLIRVRNALRKLRGNNNFTLLFCPLEKKIEDFENICVRQYKSDTESWNFILSKFPFTLDKIEVDESHLDNTYLGNIY